MDEINRITEELKICDDPVTLAEYLTKLAGWSSYYSEMLKKVMLVKPQKWLDIKNTGSEKPLSDKQTDMVWQATEDGQKEIALTYQIKRIDQMYRAISKRLWATEQEFRKLKASV